MFQTTNQIILPENHEHKVVQIPRMTSGDFRGNFKG